MGNVLPFLWPYASPPADCGIIQVYRIAPDTYEVGHESAGGNSWGYFSQHGDAAGAIAAAVRLNRESFWGGAEVFVPDAIRRMAEDRGRPSLDDLLGPSADPLTGEMV